MARTPNGGQKDCAQMWFGADFRGSLRVQAMSWAEQGMYRHLLDLAWENGGIPADLEDLRSILRLSEEEFASAWKRIGRCFVVHPSDPARLVNERQERERIIRADIRQKRLEASSRGNQERWGDRKRIANGSQTDPNGIANGSQGDPLSPPPPPSPSRGPVLPLPAGPDVRTHPSRCTSSEQQDDRSAARGPAGGQQDQQRQELLAALRATSYAQNARDRDHKLFQAVDRLINWGIAPKDLLILAKRAARKGEKPGGLFAHWMQHTDEALKELGKRLRQGDEP